MTMTESQFRDIYVRLENLEKQNRKLRKAGAVFVLLVSAILLMAQAPTSSKRLTAEEFVLTNAPGKVGARLTMQEGPALRFYDGSQAMKAELGLYMGMPNLHFKDTGGVGRTALALTSTGWSLLLANTKGKPLVQLDALDELPRLYLEDTAG